MRSTTLACAVKFAALFALSNLAAPLTAQDNGETRSPRVATPSDLARAEALLDEARLYEATPDRSGWLEAARLHVASAALRPLGDEQVFRSLHRAAQMLTGLGRDEAAQRTLEQAAEHARLYGHIQREVEALLGAAWIADRRGDVEAMNRHLSRAFLLTYAPLLPSAEREDVRRRVLLPIAARIARIVAY